MNLNDAYTIVIEVLLPEASNPEYIEKLNHILNGIKGKKHIEEFSHPRYQSILLFGHNIFTFRDADYIRMAEFIKGSSHEQ